MAANKVSLGPLPLAYPLPAFLVGSYDKNGNANIMTAAWGGICSSKPPCLAVSVRPERWTHHAITERKAFTVSIPSARLAAETDFAGIMPGKSIDKFAAAGLTAVHGVLVDAPYVAECPIVIELKLLHTLELGSHTQFVGEILDVKADNDCLDANKKPDIAKIDPLIYDGGSQTYYGVGRSVGPAFSIGKTIKNK